MRTVRIPAINWPEVKGVRAVVPVVVYWPELRLTMDQIAANAMARACDRTPPFPDNSIFEVVIERPTAGFIW